MHCEQPVHPTQVHLINHLGFLCPYIHQSSTNSRKRALESAATGRVAALAAGLVTATRWWLDAL